MALGWKFSKIPITDLAVGCGKEVGCYSGISGKPPCFSVESGERQE